MISDLGHTAFATHDLERSLAFYALLGIKEAFRLNRPDGQLMLIYLHVAGDRFIEVFPGGPAPDPDPKGSFLHICLLTEDIRATVEHLRSHGVAIDREPKIAIDRNTLAWVRDPDGNAIELMQLVPDSPQKEAARHSLRPGSKGEPPVKVYDSRSADYHHAFQVFLDHTDQKARAREWLDRQVAALRVRQRFIDAGAGNGKVTAWLTDQFEATLAIEPNPSLAGALREACPKAEVHAEPILEVQPRAHGDLVLCSHVFYYLDRTTWMSHLEKLVSWLSPDGVLVVVLQNHQTDCMKMLDHFFGQRFDLSALGKEFALRNGSRYRMQLETVPAAITTQDFASAYTVAEFMLNLLPIPNPPARQALERYVREYFTENASGFRFSCDQDFLVIRRQS